MSPTGQAEKGPAEYGREALSQWVEAARYGVKALAARREAAKAGPSLKERLDPTKTDKDGAPEGNGVAAGEGVGAGAPLPIQTSIDVALPVAAVFDLCTRFEEFPQIVDRVSAVEIEDDTHFTVVARVGKRAHRLEIELVDERPDERLDWECVGELEHSGVLTLHPLAPRLTRMELTVERDSEGLVEHLGRLLALPERGLKQELRRFKAVAELWEDGKGYESTGEPEELEEEEEAAPEG